MSIGLLLNPSEYSAVKALHVENKFMPYMCGQKCLRLAEAKTDKLGLLVKYEIEHYSNYRIRVLDKRPAGVISSF